MCCQGFFSLLMQTIKGSPNASAASTEDSQASLSPRGSMLLQKNARQISVQHAIFAAKLLLVAGADRRRQSQMQALPALRTVKQAVQSGLQRALTTMC